MTETLAEPTTTPDEVQEADAAFEAGFKETRNETPVEAPAPKEAPVSKADGSPAAAPEGSRDATATVAPETPVRLSDAELKAMFERIPGLETKVNEEIRKVYGKVGEIQGNIQKIQQGQPTRKIEAGALKRLNQEFPEIAQMLADDLSEVYAPAAETKTPEQKATMDEARLVASFQKVSEEIREERERTRLTIQHPDWEDLVQRPEFGAFMNTLSPEDRTRFMNSPSAKVAAQAITQFKAWQPPAPNARSKERLSAAITPKGDGGVLTTTLDDEAAFAAGFKSVRSG